MCVGGWVSERVSHHIRRVCRYIYVRSDFGCVPYIRCPRICLRMIRMMMLRTRSNVDDTPRILKCFSFYFFFSDIAVSSFFCLSVCLSVYTYIRIKQPLIPIHISVQSYILLHPPHLSRILRSLLSLIRQQRSSTRKHIALGRIKQESIIEILFAIINIHTLVIIRWTASMRSHMRTMHLRADFGQDQMNCSTHNIISPGFVKGSKRLFLEL